MHHIVNASKCQGEKESREEGRGSLGSWKQSLQMWTPGGQGGVPAFSASQASTGGAADVLPRVFAQGIYLTYEVIPLIT